MAESEETVVIDPKYIEFILKPIFNRCKQLLSLEVPENIEEISTDKERDIIAKYEKEITKIYKLTPNLLSFQELIQTYCSMTKIVDLNNIRDDFLQKVDLFTKGGLLIKIEMVEKNIQLIPETKLLITPLGIAFLLVYYLESKLTEASLEYYSILFQSTQRLGLAYSYFLRERIMDSLKQSRMNLTKNEIVIALLLILAQAVSPDHAIKLKKPADGDLLVPLSYIGNYIFGDRNQLFADVTSVDGAIRRTTGAGALEGKIHPFYKKEDIDKKGYLVFFQIEKETEEEILNFIIGQLMKSVKTFEESYRIPYSQKVLELVDRHASDRNVIFQGKTYVRESLLVNPNISATYLQMVKRIFSKFNNI